MVLGRNPIDRDVAGRGLGLAIIAVVVLFHVAANYALGGIAGHPPGIAAWSTSVRRKSLHRLISVQDYPESIISPFFRINGYPADLGLPPGPRGRRDLRAAPGERLRRLSPGGLRPGRESPESLAGRPPGPAQAGADHASPLHPGLDLDRQVGGRPPGAGSSTLPASPGAKYLVFHSFGEAREDRQALLRVHRHENRAGTRRRSWPMSSTASRCPPARGAAAPRFETKLGFKMVKFLQGHRVRRRLPPRRRRHGRGPRGRAEFEWGPRSDKLAEPGPQSNSRN